MPRQHFLKRGRGACKIVCRKLCFILPFYKKGTASSDLFGFSCVLSKLYGFVVGIVLVTAGQL